MAQMLKSGTSDTGVAPDWSGPGREVHWLPSHRQEDARAEYLAQQTAALLRKLDEIEFRIDRVSAALRERLF
jgi:hypothetical protein